MMNTKMDIRSRRLIKLDGWDCGPVPPHKDPLLYVVLKTLVNKDCYFKIRFNASLKIIEDSKYSAVLDGAHIREVHSWRYPDGTQQSDELEIVGQVGDVDTRCLHKLEFDEDYGAESLEVWDSQGSLLSLFEDPGPMFLELELTQQAEATLRRALSEAHLQLRDFDDADFRESDATEEEVFRM